MSQLSKTGTIIIDADEMRRCQNTGAGTISNEHFGFYSIILTTTPIIAIITNTRVGHPRSAYLDDHL